MKTRIIVFITLIFIALFQSCSIKQGSITNPDKYFNKMAWMQEAWHSKSSSTEQIEEWKKNNNTEINTEQHIIIGKDTIYDEYGRVYYNKETKNICYESVIGKYIQEAEETYYLYKCNKRKIVFEIFRDEIRYTTTYEKRGKDKVKIIMTTYLGVEPHVESYTMQKINN